MAGVAATAARGTAAGEGPGGEPPRGRASAAPGKGRRAALRDGWLRVARSGERRDPGGGSEPGKGGARGRIRQGTGLVGLFRPFRLVGFAEGVNSKPSAKILIFFKKILCGGSGQALGKDSLCRGSVSTLGKEFFLFLLFFSLIFLWCYNILFCTYFYNLVQF